MKNIDNYIAEKLEERRNNSSLRTLSTKKHLVDFASNDYLGFSQSDMLRQSILEYLNHSPEIRSGSTGSRLITGNSDLIQEIETEVAEFHQSEAALIFNSGYTANLGFFASLPQKGDTIITDEFIHASIIDGCRLSFANRYTFKHNDLGSLEEKLRFSKGKIYVAVESIYSMDGDEAPLAEIAVLTEKYGAALIVDEAHSIGIFGQNGRGLVCQYQLEQKVFARIITFGKALGCHGAAILGTNALRSYLINFARSFIYTTAASPFSEISIKMAYSILQQNDLQHEITDKIRLFRQESKAFYSRFVSSFSPIQCLIAEGNKQARHLEAEIQQAGFYVRSILHPTVPLGKERLRICLHTYNTTEQITGLTKLLKELL